MLCERSSLATHALDRLPDPDRGVEEQLAAAGLLVAKGNDADAPPGAVARALETEVEAWLGRRSTGLGLSDAVLEDRSGR